VGLEAEVELLGVLVEPQRRRVYETLVASAEPVTLSELAETLGMGRTLSSFHLGKLVEAGFVEVLPAQAGTQRRGRPSQRYRATRREVTASVPARRYDVIASVLLDAAAHLAPGEDLTLASRRAARRHGARLAADQLPSRRGGLLRRAEQLLDALGYAPRRQGGQLVLGNCPFDKLRDESRELVCGINHALAEGYLHALDAKGGLTAQLRPCPDSCCIVVAER
jgi:predicted ArsR family transcriptional regulator